MQKKYEYIKEQCDLAVAYAKDGAYYSAARVLQSLANDTADHANAVFWKRCPKALESNEEI